MSKVPGKERSHYNRSGKRNSKYYSLRSLVPEITGVKEESEQFEAARKDVERILKMFKEMSGREGQIKTSQDDKDLMVHLIKSIYTTKNAQPLSEITTTFNKVKKHRIFNTDDCDVLTELMTEGINIGQSEEEKQALSHLITLMKADVSIDLADEVAQTTISDMRRVLDLDNFEGKNKLIKQYQQIQQSNELMEWRKSAEAVQLFEQTMAKVYENQPRLVKKIAITTGVFSDKEMKQALKDMGY